MSLYRRFVYAGVLDFLTRPDAPTNLSTSEHIINFSKVSNAVSY